MRTFIKIEKKSVKEKPGNSKEVLYIQNIIPNLERLSLII